MKVVGRLKNGCFVKFDCVQAGRFADTMFREWGFFFFEQ